MSYQVRIESTAERDLDKLPKGVLRRVDAILMALKDNPTRMRQPSPRFP